MTILEWLAELLGSWFLIACAIALTWAWSAPSVRSGPKPTPTVDVITDRLRRRDAKVRGAIHHPKRHPVEYATLDELMPNIVEVD